MAEHSSQKNIEELNQVKNDLQDIQSEWLEVLEDLGEAKEEIKKRDLFATLDYLTVCDQLRYDVCIALKKIDSNTDHLKGLRNKFLSNKTNLDLLDSLIVKFKELKASMHEKLQNIDDEYPVLAENILRRSEDLIVNFVKAMQQEKTTPTLKTEIKQNLDKELFLQELKDSLESYREARENFISELTSDYFKNLPEDLIPEDLGEEEPGIDSILSQLDTTITACDTALLTKEISDE